MLSQLSYAPIMIVIKVILFTISATGIIIPQTNRFVNTFFEKNEEKCKYFYGLSSETFAAQTPRDALYFLTTCSPSVGR